MFEPVTIVRSLLHHVSVPDPIAYPFVSRAPDHVTESPRRGKLFQMRVRPSLVR